MSFSHCLREFGIIALLVIALSSSAFAAENSTAPEASTQLPDLKTAPVELNKDYFKGYLTDTEDILVSPGSWDKSDWLKATVVVGVVVGTHKRRGKLVESPCRAERSRHRNLANT